LALQKKAEDEAFRKRMEESMAMLLEADDATVHAPSEVVAEPVPVEEVRPSEEKEEEDEKEDDAEDEDDGEEDGEEEESGVAETLTDEPKEEQSQEEELRVGEDSATATIVEEQDQEQEQAEEEAEEEEEEQVDGETSTLQRRMTRFLNNVKASKINHTAHTRQNPKNNSCTFFMPLMFSDDIYFNPFETNVDNNEWSSVSDGEACVEEESGGRGGSDLGEEMQHDRHLMYLLRSFDDVNSKLKENSRTMEKQRSLLFSTTTDDINPDEWTQLFRTYNINWKAFFESEETSKNLSKFVKDVMKEYRNNFSQKDPLLARSLKKVKPFKSKAYLSTHGESIDRSDDSSDDGNYNTHNDDDELFEDAEHNRNFVIPSPVSTICSPTKMSTIAVNKDKLQSEKVLQGTYKYYKIDHRRSDQTRRNNNNNPIPNPNKQKYLITIEVECLVGLVDFFLSFRKVPCVSDFERHVTCTAKKDGKATLTFQPNPWKDGSYFIAVFSYYTDALFNIRAITTHDDVRPNPVLVRVDKILRKLEILAAKDGAAMQENYTKLEAEAKKMVDDEQYEPSAKTHADQLIVQSEASIYSSNSSSFVDNYDDTHSIGKFMVKIARYVLPPTEGQDGSKSSDDNDNDDDNNDDDNDDNVRCNRHSRTDGCRSRGVR